MGLKIKFLSLAIVLTGLLGGCASGYKQFYQPLAGVTPETVSARRAGPPPAVPIVDRAAPPSDSQGVQSIMDNFAKRGYFPIGQSSFNTGRAESDDAAIQQGKEVGADLVLIFSPKLTSRETTAIPITVPTTSTSYTTGSATAYGNKGSVTAYGSGTTTTYGSQTNYVPITISRVDYGAIYFVKNRQLLGVVVRDLNDTERQALQSNKGVVVRLVVDGTPAFDADILVDDMILAINKQPVVGSTGFRACSQ